MARSVAASPEERESRRRAILDAALHAFAERGFAATRLDDIAARAGLAKGTLYLYFDSKHALFEELVRTAVAAPLQGVEARLAQLPPGLPLEDRLRRLFGWMRTEVLATPRRRVIQLVLAEGPRFPEIAAFYHREVIARGIALIRAQAAQATAQGAQARELERFPLIAVAPAIVALIWDSLFAAEETLDVEGLFEAHLALLGRALRAEGRP